MKPKTEIKLLKVVATIHIRFFQGMFMLLAAFGIMGWLVNRYSGNVDTYFSHWSFVFSLIGVLLPIAFFEYLIHLKYREIDKDETLNN